MHVLFDVHIKVLSDGMFMRTDPCIHQRVFSMSMMFLYEKFLFVCVNACVYVCLFVHVCAIEAHAYVYVDIH